VTPCGQQRRPAVELPPARPRFGRDFRDSIGVCLQHLQAQDAVFAPDRTKAVEEGFKPKRFIWIGRAGSICLRKSFVVRSSRASNRPAPRSHLGSRKHLPRHRFPPNGFAPGQAAVVFRGGREAGGLENPPPCASLGGKVAVLSRLWLGQEHRQDAAANLPSCHGHARGTPEAVGGRESHISRRPGSGCSTKSSSPFSNYSSPSSPNSPRSRKSSSPFNTCCSAFNTGSSPSSPTSSG